ncbi:MULTISPECIES: exodeoxyribonuclease VII small subunit [Clostridium]|jgi:exodeoxyribonuclease VII small subunit|uniref:Exodeoxyribonuclease 7 small subunit n=1 Tax=Clostridium intestinale DSM 6191 TaxID=1121320 RepID=A0A1M5YZB6_9CLOT|nr:MULTISPECIES: exodeoxyribonuclease VII small subunit [Clostridium]WRY53369.1 exodeoxyribonuclease VII small subunit [Clostridium intestinale]SHI17361.1 Exodeoxyribonuclease VII small subunit [Clostridium intestinale DSM 6191]
MVKKNETYENMLEKLKDIVDKLESNELNIDDSMKMYEEGTKLVNKLYKTLDTLEGKIKVISEEGELEIKE